MDADKYLDRLHVPSPPPPTAGALRMLTRAHLEAVPFENTEIVRSGRCPSLAEADLYRKVVERRRGGYCFELNKLFYLLLRELGYDCYCVTARILYRRTPPRPLSHRAVVAEADGERWLCDVGYGGPGPKGAILLASGEQDVAGERFSVGEAGGAVTVYRHDPDGAQPLMSFRDEAGLEVDFDVLNGYFGHHPDSIFTRKLILYRCTADGMVSLVGDRFTRVRLGKTVETRDISGGEALNAVLSGCFGLAPPDDFPI